MKKVEVTTQKNSEIIDWLIKGDLSIQYQVYRDLLNNNQPNLQNRISKEGWGAKLLSRQKQNGHWGMGFYQPKWTSTHYTLLDLRNLCINPDCTQIKKILEIIPNEQKGRDGGINPGKTISQSDVCINGMALNYFAYFKVSDEPLHSVIDFIIAQQMSDGGFNCQYNRSGARHSSLHSTLSVLEGITEYKKNNYQYRLDELLNIANASREFILKHRLYKSDHTGEIIHKNFLNLSWPSRWKYDILRALDYFRYEGISYDERMSEAIGILLKKRRPDSRWPLQAKHPGKQHFEMEKPGHPSRWNTLRATRVLNHFNIDY